MIGDTVLEGYRIERDEGLAFESDDLSSPSCSMRRVDCGNPPTDRM